MPDFALINNGTVGNVAVADSTSQLPDGNWTRIDTLAEVPGIGWGYNGTAFVPPAEVTLTLAQRAQAAIGAGLTITLSGTMTLGPTVFPTDPAAQQKIGAVVNGLVALSAFPGGATTFPMKDSTGAWHMLDAAQYKAVAGAILNYVAPLQLIVDGNPLGSMTLPASSVSLTV